MGEEPESLLLRRYYKVIATLASCLSANDLLPSLRIYYQTFFCFLKESVRGVPYYFGVFPDGGSGGGGGDSRGSLVVCLLIFTEPIWSLSSSSSWRSQSTRSRPLGR